MVIRSNVEEMYRESISNNLDHIRNITRNIGVLRSLAERYKDYQDHELKQLISHSILDEVESINSVRREIEHDRARLEEFNRV